MHSTSNINDGYIGSGKLLRCSIKKYGKECHSFEILEFCQNFEELVTREKEIVTKELINHPQCMNLMEGGSGGWNHYNNNESLQSSRNKRANVKMRFLELTDPEWVYNRSKNTSKGLKNAYKLGNRTYKPFFDWNGKNHSEETKKLIGQKNQISQKGNKNSQFNTCWILKDGKSKKIKLENLNDYLNEGWNRGRKMNNS